MRRLNAMIFLSVLFFVTCSGGAELDAVVEDIDTNAVLLSSHVNSLEPLELSREDSARLRLQEYFLKPCDLPRIKDDMGMLEMGTILPAEYMHPKDSELHNYNYGAVVDLIRHSKSRDFFHPTLEAISPDKKLMSFSTYKPWKTAKDKYMSNDNEILVGLEIAIGHPAFEPGDFVEMRTDSIVGRFGEPDTCMQKCAVYLDQSHVLVLHEKNDKVDWFKMYWLNDSITTIEQLPEQLFRWK